MGPDDNKFALKNVFTHTTPTHAFEIRWTHLGSPSSPPLVFIHGTPWSTYVWHDLASALSSHYSIYLYDHPGFGLSPQPRRLDGSPADLDSSLELRAEASAALFAHWDLPRAPHVVAHDNAGLVSLRLLLERGVEFASLFLFDVVALGPFGGVPIFDLVADNLAVFQKMPANFVEGLTRAYIKTAAHKRLSVEVEDRLTGQWAEGGTQGPGRFLQEIMQAHGRDNGELEERYKEVGGRIPVKVVWGRDDEWLPCSIAERLGKALDAREVVVVDEAGHLMQYDQPSRLLFEIATWLAKHNNQ